MTAIHQVVPTLAARDAVGQHSLQVQRLLQDQGIVSYIFTEHTPAPELRSMTRPYESFGDDPADTGAVLLYQASTGSTVVDWLLDRPETVLINYHNVTPSAFFARWEPIVAAELRVGRMQIEELAPVTELGIAVSRYNASELDDFGYRASTVVPILLDMSDFDYPPDARTIETITARKQSGGAEWLFVGRVAPNKCQHDLIKAFAYYRAFVDPHAHLTLVGRSSSARYRDALGDYVRELGLESVVTFADSVTPGALTAHYQYADVFVCLSEHEGFCVPLLEAMYHQLPVVAFDAAAVPATLGPAGVVLPTKAPAFVAETVARVMADGDLRARLRAAGMARVMDFSLESSRAAMLAALRRFAE